MESLGKELLAASTQPDSTETKALLTQLAEAVNSTEDISCLIGPVMKLLPNHDILIKKPIYTLLPKLCEKQPQAAVLAANTVVQDCADLNPAVKCMAVTALTAIPELQEHTPPILLNLLEDGHPRVRLAAVKGARTLHCHSPALLLQNGLVDALYTAVRDEDPQVATSALVNLDVVLADEGGVIVTKTMARHLLQRLSQFADSQLASVLQALAKYIPTEESELFDELSCLDQYLICLNCATVTVNCIELFLKLISDQHANLIGSLVERSIPALSHYLTASEAGAMSVLNFLSCDEAQPWIETFPAIKLVPVESDTLGVNLRKLALLPRICNDRNASEMIVAVTPWCEQSICSLEAIQCVCRIRAKCPETASQCLELLLKLMDSEFIMPTVTAMQDFSLQDLPPGDLLRTLEKLTSKLDLQQPSLLPSLLPRLLGIYGELLPATPFILEHLVNCNQELEPETRYQLLTAGLRLFLKMPAECQLSVGRMLTECSASTEEELASLACTYHTMLVKDPDLLRSLLLPNCT